MNDPIPETHQSVDEQIIPFKGKHSLKRYLPKKPHKWGYKLWARSGYVYDFQVDGARDAKGPPDGCHPPPKCGESEFVVLRMAHKLEPNKHKLFFDNYFASPDLMVYLKKEFQIYAISTLNKNRSRKFPIPSDKEMKKKGRGTSVEVVDKDESIVVTAWYSMTIRQF